MSHFSTFRCQEHSNHMQSSIRWMLAETDSQVGDQRGFHWGHNRIHFSKVAIRRAAKKCPLLIKSRAMAGTIPCALVAVPLHDTTQMRAHRRTLMQLARCVAIGSDFRESSSYDSTCASRDVLSDAKVSAGHPSTILKGDIHVLFYETLAAASVFRAGS